MDKREKNETKASFLVVAGIIVCFVSALLCHLGVSVNIWFSLVSFAALLLSIGLIWISVECARSSDALKKKMIDAAGGGFVGLLLLEFVSNYSAYRLFEYDLPGVTVWYAIPLLGIYLLGVAIYLTDWMKKLWSKVKSMK